MARSHTVAASTAATVTALTPGSRPVTVSTPQTAAVANAVAPAICRTWFGSLLAAQEAEHYAGDDGQQRVLRDAGVIGGRPRDGRDAARLLPEGHVRDTEPLQPPGETPARVEADVVTVSPQPLGESRHGQEMTIERHRCEQDLQGGLLTVGASVDPYR